MLSKGGLHAYIPKNTHFQLVGSTVTSVHVLPRLERLASVLPLQRINIVS